MPNPRLSGRMFARFRMRTTLLLPLLFVSFGWTVVSLLILRVIVEQQTRHDLSSDLHHSVTTYGNLQRGRREALIHESLLLADLPTLKALMSSGDQRTIDDAGAGFWKTSGSDLFALFSNDGRLMAAYSKSPSFHRSTLESLRPLNRDQAFPSVNEPFLLILDGNLYELAAQPLIFGAHSTGSPLGYIMVGYALDQHVAQQVSEAASAEVAFAAGGHLLAGTLNARLQRDIEAAFSQIGTGSDGRAVRLDGRRYLATAVPLTSSSGGPELVVLKSFEQGAAVIRRVNRWVAMLGLLALCAGAAVLLSISRSITRPLGALVKGARAVGAGDYTASLSDEGAEEVRELSRTFERMRVELQESQKELVQSERLATIGRMASSISHDLRHYLSAIYANAEFLSEPSLPQTEREELMSEVHSAVQGMTELLDSLLLFTQTGRALHPSHESMAVVLQRAVSMLRGHPAARDVTLSLQGLSPLVAYVDSKKLVRAVYNLLLNGCQAARNGALPAAVTLTLAEDDSFIRIHVADTGVGVPESVQRTMFLPFVSEGRESGVGLGLTLAEQIASEHGGCIQYSRTPDNRTLFSIVLPKNTLLSSAAPLTEIPASTEPVL